MRAIEVLVEVFGGLSPSAAANCAKTSDAAVRARIAWALSRSPFSPEAMQIVGDLTGDEDPPVQRAAWEALATAESIDPAWAIQPDWSRGLGSRQRRVRAAAIAVARTVGQASYRNFASRVRIAATAFPLRLAQIWIALPESTGDGSPANPGAISSCLQIFADAAADPTTRLEAVRLMQIALGDLRTRDGQAEVYSGYVGNDTAALDPALRESLVRQLAPAFPTGEAELDRELARLLGMLSADRDALLVAIADKWTAASSVEDDVHYLIVASLLSGDADAQVTTATADCLLGLHGKLEQAEQFASRNWPYRLAETFDELCRRDAALAATIAGSPRLNHVGHALFIERLPDDLRDQATRKLWQATVEQGQTATAELVALVGRLSPDETLSLLRPQWDEGGLRDAIVLALAQYPRSGDRQKYVEALSSPQPAVVERAAQALVALGIENTPAEMAAALRALKQACSLGKQIEPRRSLVRLLEFWTEDGADVEWGDDPAKVWVGWYEMFADYYPAEAAKLTASSGADAASWQTRLEQIDWNVGEVAAGRKVFELRSCHRCHQASGHLGPELKGAVSRMSRPDLFTAILDPNLEVSPAYLTTLIATSSGQVYHGLVVYESPESTLLQTGPDTTVRVTNTETESMRPSTQSLMPTGLLDPLSDRELSDLYAYLKSLASD